MRKLFLFIGALSAVNVEAVSGRDGDFVDGLLRGRHRHEIGASFMEFYSEDNSLLTNLAIAEICVALEDYELACLRLLAVRHRCFQEGILDSCYAEVDDVINEILKNMIKKTKGELREMFKGALEKAPWAKKGLEEDKERFEAGKKRREADKEYWEAEQKRWEAEHK